MTNEKLVLSIVPADNLTAYNCALEVARRKDEEYKMQPISELGGWHTEPPTEDGCYLEEEYKPMTLDEAIAHAKEVASKDCSECGKEHLALAEWLTELQSYKDKTLINGEFLIRNEFTKRGNDYIYCDDVIGITAKLLDAEMNYWYVCIGSLDRFDDCESLLIRTVGQLRMFLTIDGLENIAKQFKS